VTLGRPLLADPHWPYAAAQALGVENPAWATLPAPYAHGLARYRAAGGVSFEARCDERGALRLLFSCVVRRCSLDAREMLASAMINAARGRR
jgi:hypothetical protein